MAALPSLYIIMAALPIANGSAAYSIFGDVPKVEISASRGRKGLEMPGEAEVRDQVCRFARSLFDRGLSPGSSGNISVRLDDGGWLVTPTNASLGFLDPAWLSRLDADGRHLSGDKPTKEIPLHDAVYETSPKARAIVHLHSTHSVAVSMLPDVDPRAVLPALTPYQVMRCGATALVPYHRPGDPAVADAIRGLAGRHSTILLANHGPVVAGETLEAAVYATEELEESAKLHLLLRGMAPRLLTRPQIDDLVTTFGLAPMPVCDDGTTPAAECEHPGCRRS